MPHHPVLEIFLPHRLTQTLFSLLLLYSVGTLAAAEDSVVLALDPQEGVAAVKTRAGDLQVIAVGDTFPDTDMVVTQVLPDKLVAEQASEAGPEVAQQVWIYKADSSEARSRVEYLRSSVPQQEMSTPVTSNRTVTTVTPEPQGTPQ